MNPIARLRRRRLRSDLERPLHVCVACRSKLVNPMQWKDWDGDRWLVVLRCAECDHERVGLFPHWMCEVFEIHLEAGAHALRMTLRRVEDDREALEMDDAAARFIDALRSDAIGPGDFAAGPSAS
jgi:hypothetical protein